MRSTKRSQPTQPVSTEKKKMPSRKRQRLETPELLPLMDPSANSPSSPETSVSRKSMDVFKIPDDIAQKSVNGVNALMRKLELDKAKQSKIDTQIKEAELEIKNMEVDNMKKDLEIKNMERKKDLLLLDLDRAERLKDQVLIEFIKDKLKRLIMTD